MFKSIYQSRLTAKHNGFGLLMLIIVIAIAVLLIGGGFYINSIGEKKSMIQTGLEAEKKAQDLKDKIEAQDRLRNLE